MHLPISQCQHTHTHTMVESSISAVLLCASFSLIFWNGLIHRKLTRVRRSFYTGWLYFQDAPYLSCAIQVAWLAASGYLLWSGTEEYAPAQLLDRYMTNNNSLKINTVTKFQWTNVHGFVRTFLSIYWY